MKRKTPKDVITGGDVITDVDRYEMTAMPKLAATSSLEDFQKLLDTLYRYGNRPEVYQACLSLIEIGINQGDEAIRVEKTEILEIHKLLHGLKNTDQVPVSGTQPGKALELASQDADKGSDLSGCFFATASAAVSKRNEALSEAADKQRGLEAACDESFGAILKALPDLPKDAEGWKFSITKEVISSDGAISIHIKTAGRGYSKGLHVLRSALLSDSFHITVISKNNIDCTRWYIQESVGGYGGGVGSCSGKYTDLNQVVEALASWFAEAARDRVGELDQKIREQAIAAAAPHKRGIKSRLQNIGLRCPGHR